MKVTTESDYSLNEQGFVLDGAVCLWDGTTKLKSTSKDVFCDRCRDRYEKSVRDVKDIKINIYNGGNAKSIRRNSHLRSIAESFGEDQHFVSYLTLEALVRLCSPLTGEFYGTINKLRDQTGFTNEKLSKALAYLEEKGLIVLYKEVNRKNRRKKFFPLLRIVDTDESPCDQLIIKNLKLVA